MDVHAAKPTRRRDSALGVPELGARGLEPKLPDMAADGMSVMLAKDPCEVSRVHAGCTGNLIQGNRSSEMDAQEFFGAGQPPRCAAFRMADPSAAFDQDLQHEGFDCQRRDGFGVVEFSSECGSKPGDLSARVVCGLSENRSGFAQACQPRALDLHREQADLRMMRIVVMFAVRVQHDRVLTARSLTASDPFVVGPREDDTEACQLVVVPGD